ncbi:Ferric reductase, NAD binding domain [Sesbania bispinosa]|nr:Ferric reductase, NAD binding domain [Sesbania bispinosa]
MPFRSIALCLAWTFNTAEEAARAYDFEARRIRGKKAKANPQKENVNSVKPKLNKMFNFGDNMEDYYSSMDQMEQKKVVNQYANMGPFPGNGLQLSSLAPSTDGPKTPEISSMLSAPLEGESQFVQSANQQSNSQDLLSMQDGSAKSLSEELADFESQLKFFETPYLDGSWDDASMASSLLNGDATKDGGATLSESIKHSWTTCSEFLTSSNTITCKIKPKSSHKQKEKSESRKREGVRDIPPRSDRSIIAAADREIRVSSRKRICSKIARHYAWEAKLRSVSLRLGYIGNICWAFLFFPVTRGSSILPLVGLTSESSIKYHIWLGHLSMVLFAGHTIGFIIYWAITNQMAEMIEWSKTYVSNVAGEIASLIALAMWVTSIPRIRRKMFEVFFYTHYLYILYILFYAIHVGVAYMCMIAPGIFLFLIDRHLRFLQSRQHARLLSARLLPCGALELNFSKTPSLYYNPTSIVFINVPKISKLQWHPFTVTSSCNLETNNLSVAIKNVGSWSNKLYQELSSSSLDHLNISVEGPYGPHTVHFLRHEQLVMVCGGSGIAPFISIIRELIFQSQQQDFPAPKVLLVCAFKNSADLTMLDLVLPVSGSTTQISELQLQIEAYITREKEEPPIDSQIDIQTKWFKPSLSDSPISVVLGPNNWLWLGAIISSSFLMFLLLLGIVTRICICSSAVFLWWKRQNTFEGKQIMNVEVQTPTRSPGSWIYGSERELESLPHQSLVQATKVHFGARPDLKKILFECKSKDVGVLVCGPRNMRHEVARICASGLADNLHFESISFNW